MIEFVLILPVVLLTLGFAIDVGRFVYTYTAISGAAREGARMLSTAEQLASDCETIGIMESVGKGFPLTMDPNSLAGNTDPNAPSGPLQPSAPPLGVGYIYIWPAVATGVPQEDPINCDGVGLPRGGSQTIRHVTVQIEYNFVPLTPFAAQLSGGFLVKATSVVQVEY